MVSKKLLLKAIAGMTGVAALGLSSLSFAGGDYAPAPAPTAAAPMAVEDGKTGFYIGARAGYGDNHWNKLEEAKKNPKLNIKHTGFAGGVQLGYAFNKFLAIEGGYMYLPDAKISVKDVNPSLIHANIKNYAFDIAAKVTLPIPSVENVGVYGKVGIGFLNAKSQTQVSTHIQSETHSKNGSSFASLSSTSTHTEKTRTTKPTFGAGVYWDVTPNIRVDAGWQRWLGTGNKSTVKKETVDGVKTHKLVYQPNADVVTVGVSYYLTGDLFSS